MGVRSQTFGAAIAAGLALSLCAAPPVAAKKNLTDGPRTEITVATYNVCKVNCQDGRFTWAKRRGAVARNIAAANPAVIAVQEAPTLPWRGTTQWADLSRLLARQGYRQTSDEDGCTQGCTRGAHLYYDPARIRVAQTHKSATGMESQRILSGRDWGPVQDRNLSWAYLQDIASGAVFMAVSVHLPNEKTALAEQLRQETAAGVAGWIDRQNARVGMSGIPVVVMGDLNSFQARQPDGAQQVFYNHGFVDAFTATKRVNARYPTVNMTPVTRHFDGFPPRPHRYAGLASRIDYILGKGGVVPLRHEVFLKLRSNGTFDNRYRGSDHNLVRAHLSLPVVAP